MTTCVLARAFVNADGAHGNPALVIVEPEGATPTSQQRRDLAIPATVFVQGAAEGRVSVHGNYGSPIRFGGHPSLATVDCLHDLGLPVTAITPEQIDALTGLPAGEDFTQVWAWIDAFYDRT